MTPVDQTEFSALDELTHGNCMSACLASLLDIPLAEVPNLAELGDEWFKTFISIIQKHGFDFEGTFYFASGHGTFADLEKLSQGVDGYFIVGGKSPREYVTRGHSVIYKAGKLAHDPHPSRAGLTEIEDALMIERAK